MITSHSLNLDKKSLFNTILLFLQSILSSLSKFKNFFIRGIVNSSRFGFTSKIIIPWLTEKLSSKKSLSK